MEQFCEFTWTGSCPIRRTAYLTFLDAYILSQLQNRIRDPENGFEFAKNQLSEQESATRSKIGRIWECTPPIRWRISTRPSNVHCAFDSCFWGKVDFFINLFLRIIEFLLVHLDRMIGVEDSKYASEPNKDDSISVNSQIAFSSIRRHFPGLSGITFPVGRKFSLSLSPSQTQFALRSESWVYCFLHQDWKKF